MISDELQTIADRLSAYALSGRAIEPEVCGCMAVALLDHARVVAMLETLPFSVTLATLDALSEKTS